MIPHLPCDLLNWGYTLLILYNFYNKTGIKTILQSINPSYTSQGCWTCYSMNMNISIVFIWFAVGGTKYISEGSTDCFGYVLHWLLVRFYSVTK